LNKNDEIFYILNEDSPEEVHLSQINEKAFYKFPFIGISSEVVKQNKSFLFKENPRNDKNYLDDIDNLAGITTLKNMFLGPISYNGTILGVLQLSNKAGNISSLEVKIFEVACGILGNIFNTNRETSFGVKL